MLAEPRAVRSGRPCSSPPTRPIRRCKLLLAELLSSLEAVESDLEDLDEVLGVVESQRARFPHLDDAEVAARKGFVLSSRRATLSIREDLATHAPKTARVTGSVGSRGRGRGGAEREGLLANEGGGIGSPALSSPGASPAVAAVSGGRGGGGGTREMPAACEDANASYMESGMGMQQEQMVMQEEALDSLSAAVGRIKSIGTEMNDELSSQSRMLRNLEEQVDSASDAMTSLKAKMKAMAGSKDRGKCCAICILSIVLFGLTSLVLYT